jgi:hypothetical protein
LTMDARTIGEELLGAELVAGKEFIEATGTFWDSLERGAAIQRQHLQHLLQDYGTFWTTALSPPLNNAPAALTRLLQARAEHIADSMHEVSQLVEKEYLPLSKPWTDFIDVIRTDWSQGKT